MLIMIALVLAVVALATAYAAYAYVSSALAFAALACLLASGAVVTLDRSRRGPKSTASGVTAVSEIRHSARPADSTSAPLTSDPVERPEPALTEQPPTAVEASPRPGPPGASPRSPEPLVVMPQDIDAPSVAKALLKSAVSTGNALRVTVWRGDGAGDCAAVPVALAGDHDTALVQARESVSASIEKGTALLESLTITEAGDGESAATAWRYVVPFALGEITGAASVDFLSERPDLESLNRISAAYRLPLAASLALEIARDESGAARTLIETARELARLLDPDAVVRASLARALDLTGGQSGSVMLYDQSGIDLRIVAAVGLPSDIIESTAVRPGNGIAGWVAISGQPLVVEDLPGRDTPARSRGTRSAVSVPIADPDGVLGVLNIGSSDHPSRFTATELETLEALAHQTAVALRNARAVASASELYFDTLRALALAIETRDPYAHGGIERVMGYTSLLAADLGLPVHEAHALEIAAMLHDIGMPMGCEEALSANRPLSTVEHGLITMHPVIAADILDQAPALREVGPIVYHHHERYDGTGYVDGLSGEGIPLGSRILCVADAFVAMTSDRPYRQALSDEEAIKELLIGSGTQFDPEVVDAFLAIHTSRSVRIRSGSA